MADVDVPDPVRADEWDPTQAVLRAFWLLVWIGCWGVIACAVFLTVTRAFDVTRSIRVLIAHGVTPYLYFSVWPVAALAAWRRRWILTGVALALVAIHMAVTLPAIWPRSAPAWAASAPRARVLVANVKIDNPMVAESVRSLLAHDADVMVLLEVPDWWMGVLERAGVDARYPYHVLHADSTSGRGSVLYSKLPMEEGPSIDLDRGRIQRSGVVTLAGGAEVTLYAIHLVSPRERAREDRWIDNLDRLIKTVPTLEEPFVYAGDFNATRWHPHFGRLLGTGLTDAHELNGRGLTRSWPSDGSYRVPPVLRLDHALMSDGVTATAVTDVEVPGSDHLGFVVELAVRPPGR
jgi:endonuclease/exonuclease/phosphatase (EEP) superfamily protein YafD